MPQELDVIYEGDCLDILPTLPDNSIDMILCDLPYGTTANEWDKPIDLGSLWQQYLRIAKPNTAIVLTAQGLFTHDLIESCRKYYRYSLIWQKTNPQGYLLANVAPLRCHEDILVFYQTAPVYNPQKTRGKKWSVNRRGKNSNYNKVRTSSKCKDGYRYPTSVITLSNRAEHTQHPTQKPVSLFEYLIRTYTNPRAVILDNCIGSGTTAVAAINAGRHYIGIEKNPEYVTIARNRAAEAHGQTKLSITEWEDGI